MIGFSAGLQEVSCHLNVMDEETESQSSSYWVRIELSDAQARALLRLRAATFREGCRASSMVCVLSRGEWMVGGGVRWTLGSLQLGQRGFLRRNLQERSKAEWAGAASGCAHLTCTFPTGLGNLLCSNPGAVSTKRGNVVNPRQRQKLKPKERQ